MNKIDKPVIGLGIVIALVQVLDIVIHAATDQAEPIRIIANIVIFAWLASSVSARFAERARLWALAALGSYLLLNAIFVAVEGTVNSESGQFRTVLFILMALTAGLSLLMMRVQQRQSR